MSSASVCPATTNTAGYSLFGFKAAGSTQTYAVRFGQSSGAGLQSTTEDW
jgi:hypothetical protein